jgi:penicillin G amidase
MRTLYDAVRREVSSHRRLVGLALLIILLLGAVGALAPRLLRADSAHADPAVTLAGVDGTITLSTDWLGVPHITARSTRDAALGLGYAEASDRLWQTDFLRRTGEGRVAEILGSGPDGTLTAQDALMRTNIPPALPGTKVAQASATTQAILNAFVRGVNTVQARAISSGTLLREFTLLNYTPATWTASDVMAEVLGVSAGLNIDSLLTKLERANLAAQFGPDVANALTPDPLTNATLFDR